MLQVSRAYQAAAQADSRLSDLRVTFRLVDVTAAGNAVPSVTSQAAVSRLGQTHDGVDEMSRPLASLEHNAWALDGSYSLDADRAEDQVGWWSGVLSGADGMFTPPQVLTFTFSQKHSSVGFTLCFDGAAGEWPREFSIAVYDGAGVRLALDQVNGQSGPVYISNMPVPGYQKVVITVLKTAKPFRRVRISEVVFGVTQTFGRGETAEASLLYEVDPRSESLPAGELSITIDNRDRRYNMVNPNGAYRYLQQAQPLDVVLGVGASSEEIERVRMGRFYFYRAEAKDSGMTASIIARDRLFFLDRGQYRRGKEGGGPLSMLINDILLDSGSGLTALFEGGVGAVSVGLGVPVCAHREALRLAVQAAQAVCFMGRDDVLRVVPLTEGGVAETFTLDRMEAVPDVEVSERVNTAAVSVYEWKPQREEEARESVYEGQVLLTGETELWAQYSGPAREVEAVVEDGTLVSAEYFLHAARLTLGGNGMAEVRLTGVRLEAAERVVTLCEREENEPELPVSIQNPLIASDAQARKVAAWRLALESRRLTYPIRERGSPALETGDTVRVSDAYGAARKATVTKQLFSFDGALSCETTAWGGGMD